MKLSVLDLIPVRTHQSTAQALQASAALARRADELGYQRYWVAEHHNMPAVAATAPAVVIPYLAQGTQRIRFGSGGVMLPNHAALTAAEQFALLEAMLPGRIDLGIGRAPGSDPVTAHLLRGAGRAGPTAVEDFPQDVELAVALLESVGEPVPLDLGGRRYDLRATPRSVSAPQVWLLGSSDYSAQLAARMGLPYVFAYHFGAPGIERALALYREGFTPSASLDAPRTFLTVNAVVESDPAVAVRRAQPHLVQMARLRTGASLDAQLTVEEAEAYAWTDQQRQVADAMSADWLVGSASDVGQRISALAQNYGVDEVMISPAGGAFESEPLDGTPGRERTLDLLAKTLE